MSTYFSEIFGLPTFQKNITLQTLNSKRLLIDHVEILEESLNYLSATSENSLFTAPKCLFLSTVAVAATVLLRPIDWMWKLPCCGIAALYGTCFSVKWVNQYRFRQQEKSLARLVQSLEQFEMAVKKNVLFLNECSVVRSAQHAMDKFGTSYADDFVANCVRCCVTTIKTIHASIKRLEEECALSAHWNGLYLPMEALEDCELFSEDVVMRANDPKVIKDYYNIFAYVQSQYLTRLSLSVTSGLSNLSLYGLTDLTNAVNNQRDQCLKYINRIIDSKRVRTPRPPVRALPPEVANLRTLSLALSAKLLSTIHQYNKLEESLDEILLNYEESKFVPKLGTLEVPLEEFANDLVTSEEECQRLQITLKKLLNKDDNIAMVIDPRFQGNSEQESEVATCGERIYSEQDKPESRDEFFAVDGTECVSDDEEQMSLKVVDDLDSINSKIVKRHFKPVLEQLRERIEPIGIDFKEREKRALKDKGIDLDAMAEEAGSCDEERTVRRTLYSSDSDEWEEDDRNAKKFHRSVQRYDDVRGFLAAKEQMNIFGLLPTASVVSEDVLE